MSAFAPKVATNEQPRTVGRFVLGTSVPCGLPGERVGNASLAGKGDDSPPMLVHAVGSSVRGSIETGVVATAITSCKVIAPDDLVAGFASTPGAMDKLVAALVKGKHIKLAP